jgi:hypothetical protein
MKFIFLAMLSILVSCSQESSTVDINRIADGNNDENVIVLSELNVTNSATGIIGLSDQQLGSLEQGVTIIQDLFIKNTTSSVVNFNASSNDSNVTLDKTFCTAAATRGTCKFVATIKASQTLGQQISSITINGQTLNYVLNVIPKVVPLPTLSYSNPMDVGVTQSAPISKSFTVINQSMNTLAYVIDSTQTNSQFSITTNCTSVDRNRGCPVIAIFTPTQPLVAGMVTSNFKLNGVTINIQATVDAPTTLQTITPPVNPWDFGDIEQGKSKTLSISITNRTGISDTGPLAVTGLTNFSNPSITCPSSWDRNRSCKITLTFNATGKNVQEYLETLTLKGSKIQLDLNLRANVILPSGIVPCTLANSPSYGVNINNVATVSGNIPLCQVSTCTDSNLYEVSPDQLSCMDKAIPCQLSDVQANGWNTANQLTISGMKTGNDVSQCGIQSCVTNYIVNSSLKSCEADACTMLNSSSFGVNLLNVDSVSGTTPNCIVSACSNPSLYEVSPNQKSCVDKPLACALSDAQSNGWNITNAQSPDGLKVGTNLSQCSVSMCLPNYQVALLTKTCDSIITPCTQSGAILNGVNVSNVNTSAVPVYLGNVVAGNTSQCLINSCLAGYSKAADSKSCNIITRACIASDITSLGGTTTNALTYSGTVLGLDASACKIATCSGTFEPSLNGLSCENKAMTNLTFTITNKNANGYVKDSFLQLAINTVNALEMKISDSSTCSGGAWEAFSSSKQFAVPSGRLNGTVDVPLSIQFRRNATTSACIHVSGAISLATSHLYRHDNIAPTPLTITSPVENATITASSLTFTGSCFTGVNRETGLSGQALTSAACSGSTYISQSISTPTDGNYALYVRQIDLAGNLSEVTRNIRKVTTCTSANALSGGVRSLYGAVTYAGNLTDGCTIASCNSLTTLAGDSKECIPNDITGGAFLISKTNGFVTSQTILLTGISATNAANFDIFENSNCSSTAKVSNIPYTTQTNYLASASVLNAAADQAVSILFKNNTKTKCVHVAGAFNISTSSSYRHDDMPPSPLTITSATIPNNGTITVATTTSIIFSGTCNSSFSLSVGLFGSESATTCTSNAYSNKTISGTFGYDGTFTFSAKQTDLAGNTSQVFYTVNRDIRKDLTVSRIGTGNGTLSDNQGQFSGCTGPCIGRYPPGTVVTLTATPNINSTFTTWGTVTGATSTGCGTNLTCTVTIGSTNASVSASFALKPTYNVTVTMAGTGSGLVDDGQGFSCSTGNCIKSVYSGDSVTLSATPNSNSTFVGWSGTAGCTGTSTCVLTNITSAKAVTATFNLKPTYTISVSKTGVSGTSTITGGTINCGATCSQVVMQGDSLTLTANPDANSIFTGWTGGGCSGTGACTLSNISAAASISAAFRAKLNYSISISKTGSGAINVTSNLSNNCNSTFPCSFNVQEGNNLTLTASYSGANGFSGWGGDCSGTQNTCSFTGLSSNKTITLSTYIIPPSIADVNRFAGSTSSGMMVADDSGNPINLEDPGQVLYSNGTRQWHNRFVINSNKIYILKGTQLHTMNASYGNITQLTTTGISDIQWTQSTSQYDMKFSWLGQTSTYAYFLAKDVGKTTVALYSINKSTDVVSEVTTTLVDNLLTYANKPNTWTAPVSSTTHVYFKFNNKILAISDSRVVTAIHDESTEPYVDLRLISSGAFMYFVAGTNLYKVSGTTKTLISSVASDQTNPYLFNGYIIFGNSDSYSVGGRVYYHQVGGSGASIAHSYGSNNAPMVNNKAVAFKYNNKLHIGYNQTGNIDVFVFNSFPGSASSIWLDGGRQYFEGSSLYMIYQQFANLGNFYGSITGAGYTITQFGTAFAPTGSSPWAIPVVKGPLIVYKNYSNGTFEIYGPFGFYGAAASNTAFQYE